MQLTSAHMSQWLNFFTIASSFVLHMVESNHLFLTGKLYQEHVCEGWAVAEQACLNYIRFNQSKLHVEVYHGLVDAVAANADADINQLGSWFIFPSSFTGSTCNMQQHC